MTTTKSSKALNIIAWILQGLLALTLIGGGLFKLIQPIEELAKLWPWTAETGCLVHKTAIIDILIGIGLILPSALRIYPKLTVYSAFGLVLLMISASIFHIIRGEGSEIGFNIFLGILALFVGWVRLKKVPVLPLMKK